MERLRDGIHLFDSLRRQLDRLLETGFELFRIDRFGLRGAGIGIFGICIVLRLGRGRRGRVFQPLELCFGFEFQQLCSPTGSLLLLSERSQIFTFR